MEDVRIRSQAVSPTSALRDQRLAAGFVAQYIHELSGRHADARPDRATVREPGGD
jgi:hypothetical protein